MAKALYKVFAAQSHTHRWQRATTQGAGESSGAVWGFTACGQEEMEIEPPTL